MSDEPKHDPENRDCLRNLPGMGRGTVPCLCKTGTVSSQPKHDAPDHERARGIATRALDRQRGMDPGRECLGSAYLSLVDEVARLRNKLNQDSQAFEIECRKAERDYARKEAGQAKATLAETAALLSIAEERAVKTEARLTLADPGQYAADLDVARQEASRLQQWVNDLQAGMYITCVYCGHRYGPDDEVPTCMADVLKEHIAACPEHPLFAALAIVTRLSKALVECKHTATAHAVISGRSRAEKIALVVDRALLTKAPTPQTGEPG